jgi:hypothetical protein
MLVDDDSNGATLAEIHFQFAERDSRQSVFQQAEP